MLAIAPPLTAPEPDAELDYVGPSVSQVGGLSSPLVSQGRTMSTPVWSYFLALCQASRLSRLGGYWGLLLGQGCA